MVVELHVTIQIIKFNMAVVQLSQDPQLEQFYRRLLPATCISFCSTEGRAIFREALEAGYMENYFPLAAQFRTQEEPAFCGLSTLVMVLNTLEVDPGKLWKGPWRWYHENMLDCCVPINVIEKSGITFDQLSCLAICNTLNVKAVRADDKITADNFRNEVKRVSKLADEVVVVSYSRKALGQTGSGHFSPIGGYHSGKDLVLIMDVARFKYPPHWVTIHTLFKAMQCIDVDTGLPRGYILMTKNKVLPTVLFRLSSNLCVTGVPSSKLVQFSKDWDIWLARPVESKDSTDIFESCVKHLTELLDIKETNLIITLFDLARMDSISDEHKYAITQILSVLENLPMYQVLRKFLPAEDVTLAELSLNVVGQGASSGDAKCTIRLCAWHYNVMFLLVWPYKAITGSYGSQLEQLVKDQLEESGSELLQNEVGLIRQQMSSVLGYVTSLGNCTCKRNVLKTTA